MVTPSVLEFLADEEPIHAVVPADLTVDLELVDERLAVEDRIVFNGGTHRDAVSMRYDDFARLTRPIIGRFAEERR
jgi:prolyl-tRNA editing enzyme YbaK/EbsC (Cys-tRNA(Pro) deacylase)